MSDAAELLRDPGVLTADPVLSFGGWELLRQHDGLAVLPWRQAQRQAAAAGVQSVALPEDLPAQQWPQVLIHLQKSRAAWRADCLAGLVQLQPGGRLLLCGGNELGIRSAVRQLEALLGQPASVLVNRARARVVHWDVSEPEHALASDVVEAIPDCVVDFGAGLQWRMGFRPGVFAAGTVDAGSRLLLAQLDQLGCTPRRILDLAAGVGTLAGYAGLKWPAAELVFAEADARAIAALQQNLQANGQTARSTVHWWEAAEALDCGPADLVLINPPFHQGKQTDLGPATAMFQALPRYVQPDGQVLLVANRQLPYEALLASRFQYRSLAEDGVYKVLQLELRHA